MLGLWISFASVSHPKRSYRDAMGPAPDPNHPTTAQSSRTGASSERAIHQPRGFIRIFLHSGTRIFLSIRLMEKECAIQKPTLSRSVASLFLHSFMHHTGRISRSGMDVCLVRIKQFVQEFLVHFHVTKRTMGESQRKSQQL